MKLSINRESAQALYQLAETLPKTVKQMIAETLQLVQVYHSEEECIGPYRSQILEMLRMMRGATEDAGDTAGQLAKIFSGCADRIMNVVEDAGRGQPELTLRRHS